MLTSGTRKHRVPKRSLAIGELHDVGLARVARSSSRTQDVSTRDGREVLQLWTLAKESRPRDHFKRDHSVL